MAVQEKTWEPSNRDSRTRSKLSQAPGLLAAIMFLSLAALLVVGYRQTLMRVTLIVDGQTRTVRTHQTTVKALLREAQLTLLDQDRVEPPLSEQLFAGTTVTVHRARPVTVEVDGRTIEARTQLTQTAEMLAEMGITTSQYDQVQVLAQDAGQGPLPPPLHIQIERAMSITLLEAGSPPSHFYTTARTVGEALYEAGITLYLADDVYPPMSSPIKPGTQIAINRSVPVSIHVDKQVFHSRTHRFTVGEVLSDAGILLQGLDYAEPDLNTPLGDGQEIRVVRVREEVLVQQEPIPFETQWAPDPDLEIDHQQVGQAGQTGVFERRIRVRYQDDVEVDRWVEAEWVAQAPQPKILNYGTKIVWRTLDTPSGPVQYWRKFRMFATSYTAASSGKAPDHPRYGITRLGWQMRFGIVAVDPRVVRLGDRVYVPGYGVGDAADTGGAIKGLRIDLGYDDDNYRSWYGCVDVYMLDPLPENVEYVVTSLSHPRCR